MPNQGESLASRVQQSFLELSAVASELNTVSDEMGKCVAEIDAALKQLNLGITVWIDIGRWSQEEFDYYAEQIGYTKVGGKWGVALQTVSGDHRCPEDEENESWLFNDGPRTLRLSGIQKLPEVLKALSKQSAETTKEIKGRLSEVKQIAAAMKMPAQAKTTGKNGLVDLLREGAKK